MRPEEAATLNKHHLALPETGWGVFHLDGAEPHAGKDWTDTGRNRDRRQLKQRERGETWSAPCPPELTALIHEHIAAFGFAPDGRPFRASATRASCRRHDQQGEAARPRGRVHPRGRRDTAGEDAVRPAPRRRVEYRYVLPSM